jgi:CBS domain-containing protein
LRWVIDKCDEGDILGLRPFTKDNYLMDAMAQEESLLYSIPIAVLNRMFSEP